MDNPIYLFNEIYVKFMEKHYQKDILKQNNIDITELEEHYLNIIYQNKQLTLTDFAKIAKVTKPAGTQIINKFVDKGYVTRVISTQDKRVTHLILDQSISNYFDDWYEKLDMLYHDFLNFLSQEELNKLNDILLKISKNI